MDRYVLDCSVAVKWFVPEDLSEVALHLLEQLQTESVAFLVPDSFLAEVGHALRSLVLRGTLTAEAAREAVDDVAALPIEIVDTRAFASTAMTLALANMGTFYDALYVALAEREDLKVLTADDGMANAFASLGRTIKLADFGQS